MAKNAPDDAGRSQLLDEAVVEYLEAAEKGQAFDTGAWLARYPSLTAELQGFLSDQEQVKRWTDPLKNVANTLSLAAGESGSEGKDAAVGVTPAVVGDYELLDEIARGGMGVVYRARQISLNRVVALKMVLSGNLASPAELARFRAETEAFAQLDHPNIMPIYEVGAHSGRPYFSMKLIEGGNLSSELHQFSGDGKEIGRLLAVVARAVHHAHQRGILHRDLKPDNILLDAKLQPYVTDFGLARSMHGDSQMTQSGVIVGTPSYMAPEQAAGCKDLTTAVDVYGLGAILYVLLSGSPPFRGETPVETVRQVLEEEPSRPRMLQPHVHRDLETICMKCLQKEPQLRYSSAEALAEDLDRWLAGEPIKARRASLVERVVKKAKRNPMAAALVSVVVVALLGGAAAVHGYQRERQQRASEQQSTRDREARRFADIDAKSEGLIAAGEAHLRRGEFDDAGASFSDAVLLLKQKKELGKLYAQALKLQDELQRRLAVQANYKEFLDGRGKVLFLGTQLTGVNLPKTVAETLREGQRALRRFGLLTDGGGTFNLDPDLEVKPSAVAEQVYETLLIVAEAASQQEPRRYEQALRLLDQAAALHGPTRAYHKRRARYLEAINDPSAAEHQQLADAIPPQSALDHFLLADDYRREGELRAAIVEFDKALQRRPGDFWSHYMAGICNLQLNQYVPAKVHFTACLVEAGELTAWVHLQRGIAHTLLEAHELAAADFSEAEQLSNAETLRVDDLKYALSIYSAVIYRSEGKADESIASLQRAREIKPNDYQAYVNLAKTYESIGDQRAAQGALDQAIKNAREQLKANALEPAEFAYLCQLRATLRWDDNRSGALDDIRSGLEAQPYAQGFYFLGWHAQDKLEEYSAAIEAFDASLAAKPLVGMQFNSAEPYRRRAECLLRLRRYRDASQSLDHFLANRGRPDEHFYQLRGLTRSNLGDHFGAIQDYTLAINLDPSDSLMDSVTHSYRGWVCLTNDAFNLAAQEFRRAIELNPRNGDAYSGRGYIRALAGDHAKAVKDAEASLEMGKDEVSFRSIWTVARIYAEAASAIDRERGLVHYSPHKQRQYQGRAIQLAHQALELLEAENRPEFFRTFFDGDRAFDGIRKQPEFLRLSQIYGSDRKEA